MSRLSRSRIRELLSRREEPRIDRTEIPDPRRPGLELTARRLLEGIYCGRHGSPSLGSSVEFAEHREYQPGDDLRLVDWKAWGRSDQYLVRRYRDERSLPLVLLLDCSGSLNYGEPSKFERAKLLAAVLGLLSLDQGDSAQVALGASDLAALDKPLYGRAAGRQLCWRLEQTVADGPTDLPRLLGRLEYRLRRRSLVMMISDLLCDVTPLARGMGALFQRGHELACIQVLDPTELDIPGDWGRVRLKDPERVQEVVEIESSVAGTTYREAMRAHLAACRRVTAAARADHLLYVTNRPPLSVLGPWLQARVRRPFPSGT